MDYHRRYRRYKPRQLISDRIDRALSQSLCLLHRRGSTFTMLGSTGNVYTVRLSSTPSCTCHLGASIDDVYHRRGTLPPYQLQRLLSVPTEPEEVAGETLRQRVQQVRFDGGEGGSNGTDIEIEDGATCPVCLEEMGKEEKLVVCGTCRNPIHKGCFTRWKRSKGGSATCVICRATWRDIGQNRKSM